MSKREKPFDSWEELPLEPDAEAAPLTTRTPSEKVAHEEDHGVLRKYISLKEAELQDLLSQKAHWEGFGRKLKMELERFQKTNRELLAQTDALTEDIKLERREKEKLQVLLADVERERKATLSDEQAQRVALESEIKDLHEKRRHWQEKMQSDLKRLRLKEKELDNKYELLKRDAQTLIESKDAQVLELKKKNDALELEMEQMESRLVQAREVLQKAKELKTRILDGVKLVESSLEQMKLDSD